MYIDLTEDSESEGPARIPNPRFFPRIGSFPHRSLPSSVSLKRKSDIELESTSVSSFDSPVPQSNSSSSSSNNNNNANHNGIAYSHPVKRISAPFTPSPAPEGISVVIPSPSDQLKREIGSAELISDAELTGLSEKYYPTDAHERRAIKGAYPTARKTNRSVVPLHINNPGPFLTEKGRRPVHELLCESLRKKLASIKGPAVTVRPADEKLLAKLTAGFEFVNEYKLREGVTPIDKDFLGGCGCSVVCSPDRCSCLSKEEHSDEQIIPYKRAADDPRFLVLSPEFMGRISMIYECNSLCGCNEKCWNRVIEQGRRVRLEIFHTGRRGFGLRSPDFIRAGQFIDLYLGEVITIKKADEREKIANARNASSYLFELDFHVNDDDIKDDDIYVVDGCNYGAATRFINHSCNPNCKMFTVSRTHGDRYIYDLAFFALRDIASGTELTFDYNPTFKKVDKLDPNAVPCLCGEPNCRGQLWPNNRKKAR
ncbi:hypothetical protein BJY04DRAFT_204781 [Aspergillus karnatakaensis]|uniref:histone-lysine N-methyltransferase Clr4 n=1 Tax=Aspergillus karnatakaensis TaxID=1810916 RepID=UPI003CCDF3D6